MKDSLGIILKIAIASGGLAIAIKYGAPYLDIPANSAVALLSVLLPAGVMTILLGWKTLRS
jgi:hypothetical protein